jgi:hypothetical protein
VLIYASDLLAVRKIDHKKLSVLCTSAAKKEMMQHRAIIKISGAP